MKTIIIITIIEGQTNKQQTHKVVPGPVSASDRPRVMEHGVKSPSRPRLGHDRDHDDNDNNHEDDDGDDGRDKHDESGDDGA